jgi:signal transduction histidine kinase
MNQNICSGSPAVRTACPNSDLEPLFRHSVGARVNLCQRSFTVAEDLCTYIHILGLIPVRLLLLPKFDLLRNSKTPYGSALFSKSHPEPCSETNLAFHSDMESGQGFYPKEFSNSTLLRPLIIGDYRVLSAFIFGSENYKSGAILIAATVPNLSLSRLPSEVSRNLYKPCNRKRSGSIMKVGVNVQSSIFSALAFLMPLVPVSASAAETKRVLIINSFVNSAAPFTTYSSAFQRELTSKMGEPVDMDAISLNVARYASTDMEEVMVEFMAKRQENWEPDLVVPIGSPAAYFLSRFRNRIFSSATPVIYTGFDKRRLPIEVLTNNATFVGSMFNMPGAIEDILQIAPDTRNIAIVIGASQYEQYWKGLLIPQFAPFTRTVNLTWFDDLGFDEMLVRASSLPPHSFILLLLFLQDASGVTHDTDDALKHLHAVANAPITSLFNHQFGRGIVGGTLYQSELQGIESARIAVHILKGESITNFPPTVIEPQPPAYDSRELRRWHINEANLPAASKILFREPTTWDLHKGQILLVGSVLLAQAALIALLLLNLRRRKRVEAELRQTQTSLNVATDAVRIGMLVWEPSKPLMWTSDIWKEINGFEENEQVTIQNFLSRVHSDDRKIVERSIKDAVNRVGGFIVQHRIVLPDGRERWISKTGRVQLTGNNGTLRVLSVALDITEQVLAETTTHELSSRIINAQEDERKRIARDLHDDLNQRLAVLSMETDRLGRMETAPSAQSLIQEIATQVKSLSTEIHTLSYQLHPAKLEHLGLVPASRALCAEQSKLWGIPISFVQAGMPAELDRATALSIYRVLQEALHNIGKHSQATDVRVEMTRQNALARLLVADNGRGFDMQSVDQHAGLGLLAMRERVRLAHGYIIVQSAPGKGTRIEIRIPMMEDTSFLKAS